MSSTVQEVYNRVICNLSPTERLHLATLILNDLVQQHISIFDQSDTWTEQDRLDVTTFSLQYAATFFPDNQER